MERRCGYIELRTVLNDRFFVSHTNLEDVGNYL